MRLFVRLSPWYWRGSVGVKALACIAIMAIMKRLRFPNGPRRSATQATGGSGQQWESYGPRGADIVYCKIGYDLQVRFSFRFLRVWNSSPPPAPPVPSYTTPDVQGKLQVYLDEHLVSEDSTIATAEQMKQLPYLDTCLLGVDVGMWTVGGRMLMLAKNMDYTSA